MKPSDTRQTDEPQLAPMTLEDHALLAGITDEMIDAAVQANFKAAFTEMVERMLGVR